MPAARRRLRSPRWRAPREHLGLNTSHENTSSRARQVDSPDSARGATDIFSVHVCEIAVRGAQESKRVLVRWYSSLWVIFTPFHQRLRERSMERRRLSRCLLFVAAKPWGHRVRGRSLRRGGGRRGRGGRAETRRPRA